VGKRERQTLTEDDPFEDIPDLSIDELEELRSKRERQTATTGHEMKDGPAVEDSTIEAQMDRKPLAELGPEAVKARDHLHSDANPEVDDDDQEEEVNRSSLRSKASEHEVKLHDGVPSKPPGQFKENRKQARVVTIAFSSPVVSGVNYANLSDEDFDALPREDDLPLDDSEVYLSDGSVERHMPQYFAAERVTDSLKKKKMQHMMLEKDRAITVQARAMSPVAEQDEEVLIGQMSLVHVNPSHEMTPAPIRSIVRRQKGGNKAASILCLTPLSEFSVHQVDSAKRGDQSYVEERKHPNELRQAHGSLALAVDELVKAITDAVPDELYWEQLRRLRLAPNSIASIHSLKEYCPVLEDLSVGENQISQLGGLPTSLRVLDIHNNMLNDLTSWAHLQNLQYIDVSGNQLESLEGFSSLVHLRSLRAENNRITNIDGILDLNSLLELHLGGNELTTVDFEGSELSRLRLLDLSKNQIQELRNIHCLPKLEQLDASQNLLQRFELGDADQDVSLKELQLSRNALREIGLRHMPLLRHLDLDQNNIQDVHGLPTAYHLEFLSLRQQAESSHLLDVVLSSHSECRTIRLSSNAVTNGTFQLPALPQNNLRELEIAACGISELPEGFGASFPNCRYLNANFNALKDVTTLRKMLHLKRLLLAKNRIRKLRRTCLVLSRLVSLEQVDLRDNPLTVGFYGPVSNTAKSRSEARYHLPAGSPSEDATWVKVLDEVTGLRRRTIELLLADHCQRLAQLDGLAFCRDRLCLKDETWTKLTDQGVLMKPATETVKKPVEGDEGLDLNSPNSQRATMKTMNVMKDDGGRDVFG
jgi:Leucine-rich repeat (LRR) protein